MTPVHVPRVVALVALACATLLGCRDATPPEPADVPPDTTSSVVMVPLQGVTLRVGPEADSPGAYDVAAGTRLKLLEARDGWVRLATWDDRAGWVPEVETVELSLWVHYQQALGGAPLSELRPGYPLGDGRWGAEAPPPSPGVVTSASLWVLGIPTVPANVSEVVNVASSCGGTPLRMALLSGVPDDGARGTSPVLARARVVTTAAPAPTLVALEPRPATPDADQAEAVSRIADSLAAAASGAPASFSPVAWLALGDATLWVTLAGEPERWAAAVLVTAGGGAPDVRVVIVPYPEAGASPAVRPVMAFSTSGDGRPTLFVVERVDSAGRRIDLHVAREADVRRFYRGTAWGC